MATAIQPTTTPGLPSKTIIKASDPVKIGITRLPTDEEPEDIALGTDDSSRTILHIYFSRPCQHKTITPIPSPAQERRFGPTLKQQKALRATQTASRKLRDATQSFPWLEPDIPTTTPCAPLSASDTEEEHQSEQSYFLHTPYLSFHTPPSALYTCPTSSPSRHRPAKPVALIHSGCFWRTYTIQLGASLAQPGVIDPRGVVSRRHGGSKEKLKTNERALKGYKVRGWRLWGETGKAYVHRMRSLRASGAVFADPDASSIGSSVQKVGADEVVTLRWTAPLSRQTRTYGFTFRGVVFKWKGTRTVRETRKCGRMLRYCHLKLVAVVPFQIDEKEAGEVREVCLGTFRSSIAAEKSGTLEIFDQAVLRFVEEAIPGLIEGNGCGGDRDEERREDGRRKIECLKKGVLYQLIVATALCVASAEKEKRHALIDLIIGIAENGGNGGG